MINHKWFGWSLVSEVQQAMQNYEESDTYEHDFTNKEKDWVFVPYEKDWKTNQYLIDFEGNRYNCKGGPNFRISALSGYTGDIWTHCFYV